MKPGGDEPLDLALHRELVTARRQLPPGWGVEPRPDGRLQVTRELGRSGFGATFSADRARDAVRTARRLEGGSQ